MKFCWQEAAQWKVNVIIFSKKWLLTSLVFLLSMPESQKKASSLRSRLIGDAAGRMQSDHLGSSRPGKEQAQSIEEGGKS